MALLDLQALETEEAPEFGGGGGGGSRASLLLCGNSSLSLVTCN
ncbi:SapB/AmfS family lanthipeptide [Embleya sp. NPDC008237]